MTADPRCFPGHRTARRLMLAGTVALSTLTASASALAAAMPHAAHTRLTSSPAASQAVAPGQVPTGISASDWASVQRQIAARRYYMAAPDQARHAYRADNPSLGLAARFHADGSTRVQVSGAGHERQSDSASLRLTGLG